MKSLFLVASEVDDKQKGKTAPQVWKNVKELYTDYRTRLNEVKATLEKFVR